ncbi:MAG TPA: coproporphyrinogen dehydrogenase HemZ, partial [Lachnospiraceae bacterium]|nr:coproporphyrinogen dehydrogenase HemZ [Lachnospiraceae bacterium]
KVDKAGIYNILIMEEKQSIVACGAGASTKAVYPEDANPGGQNRIERAENVKDLKEYISRIDEMIERKGELLWH